MIPYAGDRWRACVRTQDGRRRRLLRVARWEKGLNQSHGDEVTVVGLGACAKFSVSEGLREDERRRGIVPLAASSSAAPWTRAPRRFLAWAALSAAAAGPGRAAAG